MYDASYYADYSLNKLSIQVLCLPVEGLPVGSYTIPYCFIADKRGMNFIVGCERWIYHPV